MKNKNLTFTPGENTDPAGQSLGSEVMPKITLADGSAILLYQFDPDCSPRQHQRRAQRLPTLDTRNELGALFAAAPELLAACQTALRLIQDPDGDAFQASSAEDVLTSAIAKAKQTP